MINELTNDAKSKMAKSVEFLKNEFMRMRVGRASTAMVEDVQVNVYESQMTLKEVATISVPDGRTIVIQPWDKSNMGTIEKSLLAANLGLTPINDGKVIRINLPPLTEERRKEFVKQLKKMGEDSKVTIRNLRRDFIEKAKKGEKFTEDEKKKYEDSIQKLTDQFSKEIDKLVENKTKEIMSL